MYCCVKKSKFAKKEKFVSCPRCKFKVIKMERKDFSDFTNLLKSILVLSKIDIKKKEIGITVNGSSTIRILNIFF